MTPSLRVILTLELGSRPISGAVYVDPLEVQHFDGYVQLIGALEGLQALARTDDGQPPGAPAEVASQRP